MIIDVPPDRLTDSLNRRRRDRRQPTGKRVTPQDRDLVWFRKIHEHGPLSSSYLHAFTVGLRRSEKRARDRLTDLFHEDLTPHGGAYLDRPWQQFRSFEARYQDLVFDLAPPAIAALKDAGQWSEAIAGASGPWLHRYMTACITASIELATLQVNNVSFIPQHQILERADAKLRYPVAIEDPKSKKLETRELIPDAIFGLEYRTGSKRSYRFFIVEADRATEPTRASRFNRKSHLRTIQQYRSYIGEGIYKEHLGLTAGIMVLIVTVSPTTEQRMIDLTAELAGKGNTYLLYRTCEHFGPGFKPPPPMPELFSGEWARAGYSPFRIDQP